MNFLKALVSSFVAFVFVFSSSISLFEVEAYGSKYLQLTEDLLNDVSSDNDVYFNSWSNQKFENTSGKIITKGVGFDPYYSDTYNMWADFSVGDYKFSTFETAISIDNKWKTGSRGKTTFTIYADDKKLYSKTYANTTGVQNVKVPLPKNTKKISLEVVMEKGSQGNHGAIFENPRLTNALNNTPEYDVLALSAIGSSDNSNYGNDEHYGGWNDSPFQLTDGTLSGRGYGFEPYYSDTNRMWTHFKIEDYSYSTLETKVSLENKWRTGDRGKTQVILYADNKEIYSLTLTNNTPAKNIKAAIPDGTAYLTFEVIMDKGSQGNHGIIFENPLLTNSLPKEGSFGSVGLNDIGVAEYSHYNDYYYGSWGNYAFQLTDGSLSGRGYGLDPYYSDAYEAYMKFYIADYSVQKLLTTVSLENKWRNGDRGKTTVSLLADEKVIYKKEFSNTTPLAKLAISIPKGTTYLTLKADMTKGGNGNHGVIFKNPTLTLLDKTPPTKPSVNAVSNLSTVVTGKAEPYSKVTVKNNSKVVGEAQTNSDGEYRVQLSEKQKENTSLYVTAADRSGNVSKATKVVVLDKKAPEPPKVYVINYGEEFVEGRAEQFSTVRVKDSKKVIGEGKADKYGYYKITIPLYKKGTTLWVNATDSSGNTSKSTASKVK